jgi:hypothetical protein
MSRHNLFGTACKNCRRRGRKCDRSLPTCTSCSLRGVVCEGYVLRWVDAGARAGLAGQTRTAPEHGTNLHLAQQRPTPSTAKTPRVGGVENGSRPRPPYQAKVASKADTPEFHPYIAERSYSNARDTDSEAISLLRQQDWSIPIIVGTACDNLGGLVEYCTKPLRRVAKCH